MRRVLLFFALLALFVPSSFAASYVVGTDRELVAASPRIIAGTVIDTYSRRGPSGMIETVTEVLVEETLKGEAAERTVSVVQNGGHLGDEWLVQSGAPQFERGQRVLLFLDRNAHNDWTTYALGLGAFRAERDSAGNDILARAGEVFGFDENGAEHVERPRLERAFLDFVRSEAKGKECTSEYTVAEPIVKLSEKKVISNDVYTSGSYTFHFGGQSAPVRRRDNNLSVSWQIIGTQSGLSIEDGLDFADSKWNAQSPLIDYSRSNTPATGDVVADDPESRVIANDPHHVVDGACCPNNSIVAVAFSGGTTASFAFNGESFQTITYSDVVINDGASGGNLGTSKFNVTIAHELGHTLGLRHSNQNANGGGCAEPLDCCITPSEGGNCYAIMNSSVVSGLTALSDWDKRAIDCLYDGVCASFGVCVPPSVSTQPASKSIIVGDTTSLQVTAGGSGPFTYQWYIGESGDTSTPTGGNSATLSNLTPAETTSYWVRITGQCGDPVDSNAAVVTVNPCPDVTVGTPTATKNANGTYKLDVSASSTNATPLTYAWFKGDTPGSGGTQIGTGKPFNNVSITTTSSYWVRVTNKCGNIGISGLVTVSPTCTLPVITTQPQDQAIAAGGNATLTIATSGTVTSITWYQGNVGNKLLAIGSGASINVGPLAATTQYWAAVANTCGEVASRQVTITIAACDPPQITSEPLDATIENGAAATLAVGTSGNVSSITWYEGLVGDKTTSAGSGASIEVHPVAASTLYWAAIANECGEVSTRQVVITMLMPCVAPTITAQPEPKFIKEHETATLTAGVDGTAPLQYDWYRVDTGGLVKVGEDAPSYTTDPLTETTKFILNVTNACGSEHTDEVTVTVGKGRRRAARH